MFAPLDTDAVLRDLTRQDPDALAVRARDLAGRRAALEAEEAGLLAEVDALRAQGRSFVRDTAAWLRQNTGVAGHTARTRAAVARALAVLPAAAAALAGGRIGFDHARVLADHADSPHRDNLLDDIDTLLGWAQAHNADRFREAMTDWAADLDTRRHPAETEPARRHRRRRLTRGRTLHGGRYTRYELGDTDDALVHAALRDIAAELRRADAKLPLDQRRSTNVLYADALVEMARRSRGADVITKHRARPTILALTEMSVLWDQLRLRGWCQLDNGTRLTAREVRKMACEADIIPMVLDTNGVCLDMGRAVRLATYKQRLALRAMHATCAVEGCDVDFDWCEIHHLRPWERRGRTDLDNLVPLCTHHHTWIHDIDQPDAALIRRPDRTLALRLLPQAPTPRRRHKPDLHMGEPPPPLVPTRP